MPQRYSKPVYELDPPAWCYDLAIAVGLASLAAAHVYGHLRSGILGGILASATGLALLIVAYGAFIEPRRLTVRRTAVGSGTRALTFAFLSDLHVGPYKRAAWVRRLVAKTDALAPDLILLGGDFVYRDGTEAPHLAPLGGLRAPLGVFAILGNHDEYVEGSAERVKAVLKEIGIPLLLNRAVRLEKDGTTVAIAGAEDDWYGETDLEAGRRDVGEADAAVVMLHNPDLAPPAAKLYADRRGATLFVSGHVHGGQIRLPFWGPVPKLPHHLGRKYDRGLFDVGGIPLVIGQGVGESGPRARLFCPPAIELVTLRF